MKKICVFATLLPLLTSPAFLAVSASSVWADEIRVSATVDRNTATLEDAIALSVTVSGVQNAPNPELPPLPDFRVQAAGTSSSMQIINGKVDVSATHTYRLTPKRAGAFFIEPVKVRLGGTVYASDPIRIEIRESPATGETAAQSRPVFADLAISNPKPYVNEQVTVTFRLYRRVDVRNINLNLPLEPFRKEELEKPREYRKIINGVEYIVHEVSYAIFPSRPGAMQIPAAIVDLDIVVGQGRAPGFPPFPADPFNIFRNDPFFGAAADLEHKTLRAKPVSADVLPLPEQGKPPAYSNLVGKFAISAELGKKELAAGDTTTLTVAVAGTGNIQDAGIAPPDVRDNLKIYPDQPRLRQNLENDRIAGTKTFKFALVPLQPGEITIPPISLSYFDPEARQYVTAKTQPQILNVTPSQAAESLNVVAAQKPEIPAAPQEIKIVGKDILPIYAHLEDFADQGLGRERMIAYASILAAPMLLFAVISTYGVYRQRLREDTAFSRTRIAYKTARKKLDRLAASPGANPRDLSRELARILREYIGDKLNLTGTAFTSREVGEKLRERGFPEKPAASARELLERLEALQYGIDNPQHASLEPLLKESRQTLEELEKPS